MHKYGGKHTEVKVDVLRRYLNAYMTVMKKQSFFTLWYIDAFAGSGTRIELTPEKNDLFGHSPAQSKIFDGSAKIALGLDRKFNKYRFIEAKPKRCAELREVIKEFDGVDAQCLSGEANDEIAKLLSSPEWTENANNRGVIFLDPYGLSVDHRTIKTIAETGKLDVWYLFSFEGIYRQVPHNLTAIDLWKSERLSKTFGRNDWRDLFYHSQVVNDLIEGKRERLHRVSYDQMPIIIKAELKKVFPSVTEPLPLPRDKKPPQFLLYFCVSNRSQAAIDAANRIANHIIEHAGN